MNRETEPRLGSILTGRDICLVIGTTTGGTGSHVHSLATRLVEAGAVVTVLGPATTERLFQFRAIGATFVPVEISASPRPQDALRAKELWPFLHQAEVVHAHGLRAAFLTSLAMGRSRTPFIVTLHNAVLVSGGRAVVFAQIERVVARRATVVMGVSSDLVRRTSSLGARDARLAPVGASRLPPVTQSREATRAALGVDDSRALVLSVARLSHQKGLDVLIDAAMSWQSRTDRPLLVIAGDGPDETALRTQAQRCGVDVDFLGRRADIPNLLSAADVVVLPSRWEGSPLSAHEALQAGRPLVATSVGGVPDLVGGSDEAAALLVPAETATALAAGVARVLDEPALAASLSAGGPIRAAAWPNADRSIDVVLDVYAELIGGSA